MPDIDFQRFILRKTSLAGKRPSPSYLAPGEISLNDNSLDPGLFFETSDGNVVKAGPTAVLPSAPVSSPEKGEAWLDTESGTLKVGTAEREWRAIAAPYLGGNGTVVFVAPEFKYSTDSLLNDGQALPYQTLNRAILELSKIYLGRVLAGFPSTSESSKYTVIVSTSKVTAFNGPGQEVVYFSTDFSTNPFQEVTVDQLEQFNAPTGGIIVPSGITIKGVDLKKSVVSPTFVPTYTNPALNPADQLPNQPISYIFKCSGNAYCNDFSVEDKTRSRIVASVSDNETFALFKSRQPHGLGYNDQVSVAFSPSIDQSTGTFTAGTYYAIPYNTFEFFLAPGSQEEVVPSDYVAFSSLPVINPGSPLFTVTNTLRSAHRLRLFYNASLNEIGDYYTKVQKAFSSYFGGKVTNGNQLVNQGDYVIVGEVGTYPNNEQANTTKNSSFYANQVNLRSEYGMCWGDFDGEVFSGFKSVIANACTAVSLQNDPGVYEIYTTLVNPETNNPEQKWWNLTLAQYLSLPLEQRPASIAEVSVESQLDLLNSTPINNIRYYYSNLTSPDNKSIGIVNVDDDHRHFGFRVRNGAYGQFQSVYSIGPAIGVWSLNGGICSLTNSTSNFGSIAFKSEGFLGINTIGGAHPNSKGFVFEGIQRPLALTKSQVENKDNKKILSLGGKITSIYIDPEDPNTQIIELNSDFSPCYLLPYSLKAGTALWVETEGCTYRGFLATDGGPTIETGIDDPSQFAKIRIRASDSTIPNDESLLPVLGVPYIRRFVDPRKNFERSYSLYLRNTFPNAIAPQVGAVLRLNQTSQQLGSTSLRPNVQFDPGVLGGWGRIFTVDATETGGLGSSPQFNYVIGDTNQDQTYYVAITASDLSRPWQQGSDFKLASGSYTTYRNRNWYVAENNLWDSVYFGNVESFNESFGPLSISPIEPCSPFVDTSVLERQDLVSSTYQGSYAQDIYSTDPDYQDQTYFRGSTNPYPTYSTQNVYDGDDGSEDLGLCLKDVADGTVTYTVSPLTVIQTEHLATLVPFPQRYRPSVVEFSVLSPSGIVNPKQSTSVVRLSSPAGEEFFRVINLNGTVVRAIRLTFSNSSYPTTLPDYNWPQQTVVTVCSTNSLPEPELYDPDWTSTKKAIFRFFEVMGYSQDILRPYLKPKYWGERLLPVASLEGNLPVNGYALITDKWPLEFNQPSVVVANTHTWAYSGYYNYSRGLPQFQSNDFTQKLASDFQATTTWSGRLTITGINDKGEIVQFGPQRQALTANFYGADSLAMNLLNQQIYEPPTYVEFPGQVVIYSADDISLQFNGSLTTFALSRSGLSIPPNQLSANSMIITLGAVVQKPGVDYILVNNSIQFASAPPVGCYCNIRVISSIDDEKTLTVVPLQFLEAFDGSRTTFTAQTSNPLDLAALEVTANNTFVFLGGTEQIPLSDVDPSLPFSYSIERTSPTTIQFSFTGTPPAGTSLDVRAICTSPYWSLRGIYPVGVYSLDPINSEFNGAETLFTLKYGGKVVNAATVTGDNLIVSLGGSIQIPGVSYTVENSMIRFLDLGDAPQPGTSINLRVVSNSDFVPCNI